MKKNFLFAVVLTLAVLQFAAATAAEKKDDASQAQPQVKRQVVTREIVGEVAGISSNFIAVYASGREIALRMDKNTTGSRRGLKEIKLGDLVAVAYEETIETKEGQTPKVIRRLAKVVEFRQAATLTPETTGVLESRENN